MKMKKSKMWTIFSLVSSLNVGFFFSSSKFAMLISCFLRILGKRFPTKVCIRVMHRSHSLSFGRTRHWRFFLSLAFPAGSIGTGEQTSIVDQQSLSSTMATGWRNIAARDLFPFRFCTARVGLHVIPFRSLAIDLISHHLLQVNAGHRLAAASALRHVFFEVCESACRLDSDRSRGGTRLMFSYLPGLSIVSGSSSFGRYRGERTMVNITGRWWQMGTVCQREWIRSQTRRR